MNQPVAIMIDIVDHELKAQQNSFFTKSLTYRAVGETKGLRKEKFFSLFENWFAIIFENWY